jgi:hypothetical protein
MAATLVLGASTYYYATAWQQQRARNVLAMSASIAVTSAHQAESAGAASTDDPAPASFAASADATAPEKSGRDEVSLALARHRLEELQDPLARSRRVKELAELLSGWESAAPYIGMSSGEFAHFQEAYVDRLLQRQQRRLECQLDPACEQTSLPDAGAAAEQDRAELLGHTRYARLKAFMKSDRDRGFVTELNRQLPSASTLSESQAGNLATALAEERERFVSEARQGDRSVRSYVSGPGIQLEAASLSGAADEHAQLRESMVEFTRRQHDRAAGMLTAAQLAQFKALQDQSLATWLASLRDDEIVAAIRRESRRGAAGQ